METMTDPTLPVSPGRPLAMREPLARARHLPGAIYASPQIAAREKQRIFLRHWLCVARIEELPEVGAYLTLRVCDEPIVLSRAAEGIVAFRNRCLHRGVEVAFDSGTAARGFSCPYHAWSYDLAGRLTGAPYMRQAEVDLAGARLPLLRTAHWRGWIFVNFDAQAQPFEQAMAPYDGALDFFRSDPCRLAGKIVVEVETNWKFLVENLLDMYHVGTLHSRTFGKHLRLIRDELPYESIPGGGVSFSFQSAPLTADGSRDFAPLPWMEEHGGSVARKAAIFPNMNLSSRVDSLRMWVLWPLAPGRTQLTLYLLLHESAFAAPDFAEKLERYQDYMRSVIAEDRAAVESLQRVAASEDFEPGPMSHLEGPIHRVLNHYLDVMEL